MTLTPEEARMLALFERWKREFPRLSKELRIIRLQYELMIQKDAREAAESKLRELNNQEADE